MESLKFAVVAPCSTFENNKLEAACEKARELGLKLVFTTSVRNGFPRFLNGTKRERLEELALAESAQADAIWCVRGGTGAITLWHDYCKELYQDQSAPLIGYSDVTILHFLRFYRAERIGIHAPGFFDILKYSNSLLEQLDVLITKKAQNFIYPPLKPLNHFLADHIDGELIPMNLDCLESIIGCFDPQFFRGKILALEEVNEPHYKVFEALTHLKNVGALLGLRALLVGQFGKERQVILEETLRPLADELAIPLFDWPIFGHEVPNWPLLFGARCTLTKIDEHFFTLVYNEQHDHTPIIHE